MTPAPALLRPPQQASQTVQQPRYAIVRGIIDWMAFTPSGALSGAINAS
jgi:hypothetical protein